MPGKFDVDRHVTEPYDMWGRYLPKAYRYHAPSLVPRPITDPVIRRQLGRDYFPPQLSVQGKWVQSIPEKAFASLLPDADEIYRDWHKGESPTEQLAAMDEIGVHAGLILPTFANLLTANDEVPAGVTAAYAEAYNNWLLDYCNTDPARLKGAGIIAKHDSKLMLRELERTVAKGWGVLVIRPNPVLNVQSGRAHTHLGDAVFDDFFAACVANDLTVVLHEGAFSRVTTAGADRFDSFFARHACSHPFETMMGFLALLEGGVLERYPTLRIGLFEAGASWVPFWLQRLDDREYRYVGGELAEQITMPPSEYFKRQCWVTLETGEPLKDLRDLYGVDRLLYGSDFPHHDSEFVDIELDLRGCGFTEMEIEQISVNNPVTFLNRR